MIASYRFDNHDELCLTFGPSDGPVLLIVPPLFDEANKLRHLLVETARLLADHGIFSLMPDLPGCNESPVPLENASLSLWKAALIACAGQLGPVRHIASLRGGTLIDDALIADTLINETLINDTVGDIPRWRLGPVKTGQLLRNMLRTRIASDRELGIAGSSAALMEQAMSSGIDLAGYSLSASMVRELASAAPSGAGPVRLVRLCDDPLPCDSQITGAPLWLRAEPGHDAAMAQAMAHDIASWIGG